MQTTPAGQLVSGPFCGRQRLHAAVALGLVPLAACWPRPWSQTIGKILLAGIVLLATTAGVYSGPMAAAIAAAGFLAIALVLQFAAGAAQTTAALHRIEVLGKDRPARAWAVVKTIGNELTLSDLVAWPRRQGAGRALVDAVCNNADQSGRAVYLKATNPAVAAFYEQAGFTRTPPHRLRSPLGIPMVHPANSHRHPIPRRPA